MRLAIGLFATLAALAGAASAEAPGMVTAGLYTPMPAASSEGLLRAGTIKMKCSCKGKKPVVFEAEYCPQAQKLACDCGVGDVPSVICVKARQ
jgi:hypothetical protein